LAQTSGWREASAILKLAVTRSSSLAGYHGGAGGASMAGRTIEFDVDVHKLSSHANDNGFIHSPIH